MRAIFKHFQHFLAGRLDAMTAMAQEGWSPTLELWTELGTPMHSITPVQLKITGVGEGSLTTYTSNGLTDDGLLQHLRSKGYICSQVRPLTQNTVSKMPE